MSLLDLIDAAIAATRRDLDEGSEAVLVQMERLARALPVRYLAPPPPPPPPAPDLPDPARQLRDNEQLYTPPAPAPDADPTPAPSP